MDLIARLIEQLASDDEVVRVQAGELLLQMGAAAVRPLVDALQNPKHPARPLIAATLGQLGDKRAVEPLIAALQDPDKAVRYHAALALGKLKDRRAVRPLIRALFDEMPPLGPDPLTGELLTVRAAAAQALGDLRAAEAVPALQVLLNESDRSVRHAALRALLRIGTPDAVRAVADALLREEGPLPWDALLRHLARLPLPEAQTALERLSQHHPDPQVRALASALLAERSPKAHPDDPDERTGAVAPSSLAPLRAAPLAPKALFRHFGVMGAVALLAVLVAVWQWSRWAAIAVALVVPALVWCQRRRHRAPTPPTPSVSPPPLLSSSHRDETP